MAITRQNLTDAAALSFAAHRINESTATWSLAPTGWTVQRAVDADAAGATANGFVAWNAATRTLAVVFRGSDEIGDITAATVSQSAYYAALAELTGAVAGLADSLGAQRVLATGHSLGGAMAEIFISRTAIAADDPMLITFGSPGVSASGRGPHSIASIVGTDSLQFRHTEDPVTHPELSPLFPDNWGTMQGNVVEVDRADIDGSGEVTFLAREHLPNEYLASAQAIAADAEAYARFSVSPASYRVVIGAQTAGQGSTEGADYVIGTIGANSIAARGGNDLVAGLGGNDLINLGLGNDAGYGGDGADTVNGESGNDTLFGGANNDQLNGGDGNDFLYGGAGADANIGGNGLDTAAYNSSAAGVKINLGANSGLGGDAAGDTYSLIENLIGSALADSLTASAVANILIGGGGRDILTGGAAVDRFDFNAIAETGATTATADVISDFVHLVDDIDLSTIDASTVLGGNNTFLFRGTAAFTSAEGEVRYQKVDSAGTANDYTMVWGDTDADAGVEFAIRLMGLVTLISADFIL